MPLTSLNPLTAQGRDRQAAILPVQGSVLQCLVQRHPGSRARALAALSDGVFAVAMTLLILESNAPDAEDRGQRLRLSPLIAARARLGDRVMATTPDR